MVSLVTILPGYGRSEARTPNASGSGVGAHTWLWPWAGSSLCVDIHNTRSVRLSGITTDPVGEWATQLARRLSLDLVQQTRQEKFWIRGRDAKSTASFETVLSESFDRCNEHRPHRSLGQQTPPTGKKRPLRIGARVQPNCDERQARRSRSRVPARGVSCSDGVLGTHNAPGSRVGVRRRRPDGHRPRLTKIGCPSRARSPGRWSAWRRPPPAPWARYRSTRSCRCAPFPSMAKALLGPPPGRPPGSGRSVGDGQAPPCSTGVHTG